MRRSARFPLEPLGTKGINGRTTLNRFAVTPITSAVATPNGQGYWVLDGAGQVFPFGNAAALGSLPAGAAGGFDPASAIFVTSDSGGYWVVTALGKVHTYGDAPNDGDMSGTHLNGPIIGASGS